jgi:Rha family phage regulatory protein
MSSPNAIITVENGHIFTTSLMVAEKFEKQHKNVLRNIEDIIKKCPVPGFSRLNFEPRNYQYKTGKNQFREAPYYIMTRKGFTLLVQSLTGEKAFLWNLAYIEAFDHMEAKLRELGDTEHRALISGLYGKHPQWRETADLLAYGFTTREIADLQGKHIRNVQKMLVRMRDAGLHLFANQQAA